MDLIVLFALFGLPPAVGSLIGLWIMKAAYRRAKAAPAIPAARATSDGSEKLASSAVPRRNTLGYRVLMFVGLVIAIVPWVLLYRGIQDFKNSNFLNFGRALRLRRRARLASLTRGGQWSMEAMKLPDEPAHSQAVGEAWLHLARVEHASIPAFSLLSLQLAAHGAPPRLLADAHQAAQDEIRHAQRCFAIANALTGAQQEPARLDALFANLGSASSLAELATDSLVDGCLGEGVAADLAARGAELTPHAPIAEALREIAEDEQRHAELGWDVVAWCLERGGAEVAQALGKRAATLSAPTLPAELALPVEVARQWGVPDAALLAEVAERRLTLVRARVAQLLPQRALAA